MVTAPWTLTQAVISLGYGYYLTRDYLFFGGVLSLFLSPMFSLLPSLALFTAYRLYIRCSTELPRSSRPYNGLLSQTGFLIAMVAFVFMWQPVEEIVPTTINSSETTYLNRQLIYAALVGKNDRCDSLLARGADPNSAFELRGSRIRIRQFQTPLLGAIQSGNAPLIKRLVEAGADTEEACGPFDYRDRPLLIAAGMGNVAAVETLVEYGAAVDARSRGEETALMAAARSRQLQTVEALISQGASLNLVDNLGRTALALAQQTDPDKHWYTHGDAAQRLFLMSARIELLDTTYWRLPPYRLDKEKMAERDAEIEALRRAESALWDSIFPMPLFPPSLFSPNHGLARAPGSDPEKSNNKVTRLLQHHGGMEDGNRTFWQAVRTTIFGGTIEFNPLQHICY